jgi:hypothetical protein
MQERVPQFALIVVRQDLSRSDRLDAQALQVIGLAPGARPWTASFALTLSCSKHQYLLALLKTQQTA